MGAGGGAARLVFSGSVPGTVGSVGVVRAAAVMVWAGCGGGGAAGTIPLTSNGENLYSEL